jgi:hypothetical protein
MSTISPTAGRRSREDLMELAREFTQGGSTQASRPGFKLALLAVLLVALATVAGGMLWPEAETAPRAHANQAASNEAVRLQQALEAQRARAKAQARWQDSHQAGDTPAPATPSK